MGLKLKTVFFLILAMLMAMSCWAVDTSDYFELAHHWAPVVFQDTDDFSDSGRYDFITSWRFDDSIDLSGPLGVPLLANNWENAETESLRAYVYYSVIETTNHFYIGYFFYHPRDWSELGNWGVVAHQHDLEGITLVVEKTESQYGDFILMYTQAHDDTYYFYEGNNLSTELIEVEGCLNARISPGLPAISYSRDHRDHLFGELPCADVLFTQDESTSVLWHQDLLGDERVSVFIASAGHGVGQFRRALVEDGTRIGFSNLPESSKFDFKGDTGVIYYPSVNNTAAEPGSINTYVPYVLVPFNGVGDDAASDGIWRHRKNNDGLLFYEESRTVITTREVNLGVLGMTIQSSAYGPGGGAHSPWTWPEHNYCNDPEVCSEEGAVLSSIGDWFLDPAAFIGYHVGGLDFIPAVEAYLYNPYLLGDNNVDPLEIADALTEDHVTIPWDFEPVTTGTGLAPSIDIYLELPGIGPSEMLIAQGVPIENQSYPWDVNVPAGAYRIHFVAFSAAEDATLELQMHRYSNYFDITAPAIPALSLLSPNGGETWGISDDESISWSFSDGGSDVSIDLLQDGIVCSSLASSTPNDGQFSLTASACGTNYSGYAIRITDLENDISDESDDVFSIVPITFAYSSPFVLNTNAIGFAESGSVTVSGVSDSEIPTVTRLGVPWPNPFNPQITVPFSISKAGRCRMDIYDLRGRRVGELRNEELAPGDYKNIWDGTDLSGQRVSTGVYFIRLLHNDTRQVKKVMLLK